jgi:predicted transcriptional regulator of viral defense system
MKYYETLLDMQTFTRSDLVKLTGSDAAAMSLIYDYQKKGYIERVRRDFYVAISLETKQPVVNRYCIGSGLFDDACITHHSAFEFYGYANQVFYDCYVATSKRFRDFDYNDINYHRIEKNSCLQISKINGVNVTTLEQTAVDSIRDFEKIAGLEETLRCLLLIPGLNEAKILEALDNYANGFLYQKCGYIFESFQNEFRFSDNFYRSCQKHIAGSRRPLQKESPGITMLNQKWSLYVPHDLRALINKGVTDYDAIG